MDPPGDMGSALRGAREVGPRDSSRACCPPSPSCPFSPFGPFSPSCPPRTHPSRTSRTPCGNLVGGGAPARHQFLTARVVRLPQRPAALAQEVLVVQAQFLQAGSCDVGQLQFRLLRCPAGLAALGDVLHAASGGLHHLVVRAAARSDVVRTEAHRDVVAQLRHLETLQLPVSAMGGNERLRGQSARRLQNHLTSWLCCDTAPIAATRVQAQKATSRALGGGARLATRLLRYDWRVGASGAEGRAARIRCATGERPLEDYSTTPGSGESAKTQE